MDPLAEVEHNPFADHFASPLHHGHTQSVVADNLTSQSDNGYLNGNNHNDDNGEDREREEEHRDEDDLTSLSLSGTGDAVKERSVSVINSAKHAVEIEPAQSPADEFSITVHDPVQVGEGIKAHTVYSITTRTSSPLFKKAQVSVKRRFKEFLWLSQQLSAHNPGVIIPQPPEKVALGRFEDDFVENRRVLLERMLVKISRHSLLNKDPLFISFLESEMLSMQDIPQDGGGSGTVKKKSGFLSLFEDLTVSAKIVEIDDYFDKKKASIDSLDTQLKSVEKTISLLMKQREGLSASCGELSEAVLNLGQAEINKLSEKTLASFAQVQKQLKDIHAEQAKMDLFYLSNTVDEYLRTIGAIRSAYDARVKAYSHWKSAEQNLVKSRIALEKSRLSNSSSRADKTQRIEQEILEGEQKVVSTKKEFEDISKLLKSELENFEREKIVDIQNCLKGFLTAVVDTQKKTVTVWEEFLKDLELVSV